jgi:hypothetical protein
LFSEGLLLQDFYINRKKV